MRVNQENKSIDMEARDINYILPAYVRSYLFYSKNEMPEKIIFPMFPSVVVQGKEIPIEYVSPLDAVAVEIAEDGADVAEITPEQEAALDEKDETIKLLKAEVAALTPQQLQDEAADLQLEIDTAAEEYEAEHGDTPRRPEGSVSPARAAFAESPPEADKPESDICPPHWWSEEGQCKICGTTKEPEAKAAPLTTDRKPRQPPGGDIGPGSALSDMGGRDRRDQVRTAKDLMEEPEINEVEEKEFDKDISRDEEGRPVVDEKHDTS